MDQGKKSFYHLIYGRTIAMVVSLIIQTFILFAVFRWLGNYQTYIFGSFSLLSMIILIAIINRDLNPAFKIAWIIPIMLFPVFGGLMYLFLHFQGSVWMIDKKLRQNISDTQKYLVQKEAVMENLHKDASQTARLASYMNVYGGYPIYQNTDVSYFPLGEDMFAEMVTQLENAKDFIFMEYFIVDVGYMWDTILDILKKKAAEGVEVRFMYDGMCCLALLPYSYPKELERHGIQCKMFSPVKPALSTHQNNRDHRKILVIDGKVAFTGGVNLADEYINRTQRFGHWKDTAVMLTGDAVTSFTMMFLQMWDITEKNPDHYEKYICSQPSSTIVCKDGFVMPYGDSPLDHENIGEQVYLDIFSTASDYVHVMTPYLILDNEMVTAMTYAAKRGVQVQLILPHIPDKKTAFYLAHTHYPQLLAAGIEIYEYTPGFVHAKVFTSDDEKAVVGTINLDYRSLYLHFECAAYMYRHSVIPSIEEDFQKTLAKCQRITLADYKKFSFFSKLQGKIFKLFAPLM